MGCCVSILKQPVYFKGPSSLPCMSTMAHILIPTLPHCLDELTTNYRLLQIGPTGCVESLRPEVRGKARGSVELDCNFPSFNPADAPASLHVLEWVREGFEVAVLIKFGPHEPRVHPKYEGELSSTLLQHTVRQEIWIRNAKYECSCLSGDSAQMN